MSSVHVHIHFSEAYQKNNNSCTNLIKHDMYTAAL